MLSQSHYLPPPSIHDFAGTNDGLDRWHRRVSALVEAAVDRLRARDAKASDPQRPGPQFFDACSAPADPAAFHLPLVWNAFPRSLLSRFGRGKALAIADMLVPAGTERYIDFDPTSPAGWAQMRSATNWIRPQNEYCEWRVERDARTGQIRRVVFTVEWPEQWDTLHGCDMPARGGAAAHVAALYGKLLGQAVPADDLLDDGRRYDPRNRWNTTDGLVHLAHPNNGLDSAIDLLANSTLRLQWEEDRPLTHPEELCCSLRGRDPNRHSDPTIVGTVNALARAGHKVSLVNPVALSIAEVDTQGWLLPDGTPGQACLRIERGDPACIQRLVVEAPAGCRHGLGALTIAGEPLLYGGQIAECITVRLGALCTPPGPLFTAVRPERTGKLMQASPRVLKRIALGSTPLPGWVAAFSQPPPPRADAAPEAPVSTP